MSRYLYFAPEKYGLEVVAEYDAYEEPYEFTLTVVWRETASGRLWAANDTGCSCPVPFEDHKFPGDFTEIRGVGDLLPLLAHDSGYRRQRPTADFVRQVEEALGG